MPPVNRRRFLSHGAAAGVGSLALSQGSTAEPRSRALMKVGCQRGPTTDEMLQYFAQFGVKNICGFLATPDWKTKWQVDDVAALKKRVESFGISLDMMGLPLTSSYITKAENPNIMLGKSPERDREIDNICGMIRVASKVGIPALKYNLTILGVVRGERTPGRGGASYSTFIYSKTKQEPELTEAGRVTADEVWDRITYFLKRVVPVAEECKVKLACHPNDPAMPADKGFRGVHPVLGTVAGLKKFVEIQASPYHGLNFCQGTICEGLENPNKEILDVIRWFGTRKKIFNVHFRNIRGGFLDFRETYPDDGDVDMLQALRVYKEVGFDGMMMPDHMPQTVGDANGRQAFAFGYGYIRGADPGCRCAG